MQSVSSRIWTCVAVSISSDDKHYTMGTLSGAATPDQSGPGTDGNEKALGIPQISRIIRVSSSDSLVSYPRHSLMRVTVIPVVIGVIGICNVSPWPAMNPADVVDRYIWPEIKSTKWLPENKQHVDVSCDQMENKHCVGINHNQWKTSNAWV